jgi:addiction module RelE/StbE family toxin
VNRPLVSTPAFVRAAKKLYRRHSESSHALREALLQLESDAFAPALRTHKLKGDLAGRWACTAGYDLRVVFKFVQSAGAESILLLTVGSHDEVY